MVPDGMRFLPNITLDAMILMMARGHLSQHASGVSYFVRWLCDESISEYNRHVYGIVKYYIVCRL